MPRLLMRISVSGTCWMRGGCAFGCSGIGDYGFYVADSGDGFVNLLLAVARDRDGDAFNREGLGDGEADACGASCGDDGLPSERQVHQVLLLCLPCSMY
jgi:hypothetical protein